MNTISVADGAAVVELSKDEVLGLIGAINEMRDAVKDWELHARTGVDAAAHEKLRNELKTLLGVIRTQSRSGDAGH